MGNLTLELTDALQSEYPFIAVACYHGHEDQDVVSRLRGLGFKARSVVLGGNGYSFESRDEFGHPTPTYVPFHTMAQKKMFAVISIECNCSFECLESKGIGITWLLRHGEIPYLRLNRPVHEDNTFLKTTGTALLHQLSTVSPTPAGAHS